MSLIETYKMAQVRLSPVLFLILLSGLMAASASRVVAMPADSIEVVAKNAEINKSAIYQINFAISKPLPPKAVIRVTFPSSFDLSDLMVAGSTTINGGFILKVDGQVVTMKRSGLGRVIPANEKVDIKFAIVKNPNQPAENYRIVVEILDEEEKAILKEDKKQKISPARE